MLNSYRSDGLHTRTHITLQSFPSVHARHLLLGACFYRTTFARLRAACVVFAINITNQHPSSGESAAKSGSSAVRVAGYDLAAGSLSGVGICWPSLPGVLQSPAGSLCRVIAVPRRQKMSRGPARFSFCIYVCSSNSPHPSHTRKVKKGSLRSPSARLFHTTLNVEDSSGLLTV